MKCKIQGAGIVIGLGALVLSGCEPDANPLPPEVDTSSLRSDAGSQGEAGASMSPGGSGAGGSDEGSGSGAELAEVGASCSDDGVCETGACVDGFCCEAECDGLCVSCGVEGFEGQCVPAQSDEVCSQLKCPEPKDCLDYDTSQAENNCESAGQCRADISCAELPKPAGTVCGTEGAGLCDGSGVCDVPNKASLGEGCSVDDDCGEGNCVEGAEGASICCDSACDGVCEACGSTGRCDSAPDVDARCEAEQCPADNVCRNYPELAAGQCGSFGVCEGADVCFDEDNVQDLRPDAQCSCNAEGDCELRDGVSCEQDQDCGQAGACEQTSSGTSVCCAERCGGSLFCARDGSECVECEGSVVSCQGNDEQRCTSGRLVTQDCANGCTSGTGCNTAAPIGFSCAQSNCQAGAVCQQDNTGAQRCCSRDCDAEGKVCGTDGSCECPPGQTAEGNSCLRQSGERCDNANQCQGGRCTDGVCCAVACDGFCEQCQLDTGLCVAVPAEQQDDGCNNTHECTGVKGDCRARTGESCSEGEATGCVTGICSATAGGGAAVCCAENCGVDLSCSSNGLSCVECETDAHCPGRCNRETGQCVVQRLDGEACDLASECESGICSVWYIDNDGDSFGTGEGIGICGVLRPEQPGTFSLRPGDCCDRGAFGSGAAVNPNTVRALSVESPCGGYDHNCDGVEERMRPFVGCGEPSTVPCQERRGYVNGTGDGLQCGDSGVSTQSCRFVDGICVENVLVVGGSLPCL